MTDDTNTINITLDDSGVKQGTEKSKRHLRSFEDDRQLTEGLLRLRNESDFSAGCFEMVPFFRTAVLLRI